LRLGIFAADGPGTARLEEEAGHPAVAEYLKQFPPLRVRLVRPLAGATWLAYPANEGDMSRRHGMARPIPVHLVAEADPFEQALAHLAGGGWWFGDADRRSDPRHADHLRAALRAGTMPDAVAFPGLTPEMRTAYDLAAQADDRFRNMNADVEHTRSARTGRRLAPVHDGNEARLRRALQTGGGNFHSYSDRGEYWIVEWSTRDGSRHTSAVEKRNLGIISSGICLSGEDHKFDLQSLVPVIEGRDSDW